MRVPTHEVLVKVADQGRAVQVHELLPQNSAQLVYICGVRPIRVVHGGISDALLLALESSEHHVR